MPKTQLVAALLMTLIAAARASAQEESLRQCATITVDPTRRYCNAIVEAMEITQARVGHAAAGGNPVPGASSTLGMRLGAVPRISLGARFTGVKLTLPPLASPSSTNEIDELMSAFHFDASLGIFSGFSLLPTVGGFASLDLVASLGRVPLPDDQGFQSTVTTWGIGARLGILRESFTAPGLSVTAMYRGFSSTRFGDSNNPSAQDAYFELSGTNLLSLRGVVGKRLLFVGAMAGVGYDRIASNASFGRDVPTLDMNQTDFREDGFDTSRTTIFGSVQWTLLILSIVGEAGWQSGGDAFTAPLPAGQSSMTEKKAYFGSIALRLSI